MHCPMLQWWQPSLNISNTYIYLDHDLIYSLIKRLKTILVGIWSLSEAAASK